MKKCPSFIGYSATEDGRIFSHRRRGVRIAGSYGGTKSMIDYSHQYELSQFTTKKGYKTVCIMQENGKARPVGVHQLVADAYIGKCPDGQEVRHIDGIHANNFPHNLCYGTSLQNADDRKKHGNYASGENHLSAKLTSLQVSEIKFHRAEGVKFKELASKYGVSVSTIEGVIYGKTYKVIKP